MRQKKRNLPDRGSRNAHVNGPLAVEPWLQQNRRPASRPRQTRAEGSQTCAAKRSVKSHTAGLPACPSSDKPFSICSSRKSLKYSKRRLRFKAASSGNLQLPKSLGQNTELSLLKVKYAHVLVALGMLINQAITRTFYISTKRKYISKEKANKLASTS